MANRKGTGKNKLYTRDGMLHLRWYNEKGQLKRRSSGYPVSERAHAQRLLDQIVTRVRLAKATGTTTGRTTVSQFAELWLDERDGEIESIRHERARQRLYIGPHFGAMFIDEVTAQDCNAFVRKLKKQQTPIKLAPRTIRSIWGQVSGMFRSAQIKGLIDRSPCILERRVLPPKEDKDPEWRAGAYFEIGELVRLMSDPRIDLRGSGSTKKVPNPDPGRRVMYAIKTLTGARHGEVAGLRWRHIHRMEPLDRLVVANSYARPGTKTNKTREVPIHPILAATLNAWREKWPEQFGRTPRPDDLIVPCPFTKGPRCAKRSDYWFKQDLKLLGLRERRGHDYRTTFISLGQEVGGDQARPRLEAITHKGNQDVMSGYTRFSWPVLCSVVSPITLPLVSIPGGGELALDDDADGGDDAPDTDLTRPKKKAPEGAEKPTLFYVRRGGLESVQGGHDASPRARNRAKSHSLRRHSGAHDATGCVLCAGLADAARAVLAVADSGGDVASVVGYLRHALGEHERATDSAERAGGQSNPGASPSR